MTALLPVLWLEIDVSRASECMIFR
jgi:hypothetical protein